MKKLHFLFLAILTIACSEKKNEYQFVRAVSGTEFRAVSVSKKEIVNIKIFGVESPKYNECFSLPAQVYLDSLLSGKTLTLEVKSKSDHLLTAVVYNQANSIAYKLLGSGMAKVDKEETVPVNYKIVEGVAREEEMGVWSCD